MLHHRIQIILIVQEIRVIYVFNDIKILQHCISAIDGEYLPNINDMWVN